MKSDRNSTIYILAFFTLVISISACKYPIPGNIRSTASLFGSLSSLVSSSRFVAVGDSGQIWYSSAGTTWTDASPGGSVNIKGIVYGGDRFVAVGDSGQAWWSFDGISWTDSSPGGNNLTAIAYGGGRFVAVGNTGQAWWSTDGINWTDSSPGGNPLTGIAYGGGRFVAVGFNGQIWWSTNGDSGSWNDANVAAGNFGGGVAYGGGRFVAGAWGSTPEPWRSTDGTAGTWTLQVMPTQNSGLFVGLAYGFGRFIGIEWQGLLSYSPDGSSGSWTAIGYIADLRSFGIGNGQIMSVGFGSNIVQSTDGISWSTVSSGVVPSPLTDIAFGAVP